MSAPRLVLLAGWAVLVSAGTVGAEECGPKDIGGKHYTCCKKEVKRTGKLACDDKAKVNEKMRCGEKIETTYECTEVVEKKK